jgi:hypothetical protein
VLGRWRLGAAFKNTDIGAAFQISARADPRIDSQIDSRLDSQDGPSASERAEALRRKLRLLQQTAKEQQAEMSLGAERASAAAVRATLIALSATGMPQVFMNT